MLSWITSFFVTPVPSQLEKQPEENLRPVVVEPEKELKLEFVEVKDNLATIVHHIVHEQNPLFVALLAKCNQKNLQEIKPKREMEEETVQGMEVEQPQIEIQEQEDVQMQQRRENTMEEEEIETE